MRVMRPEMGRECRFKSSEARDGGGECRFKRSEARDKVRECRFKALRPGMGERLQI